MMKKMISLALALCLALSLSLSGALADEGLTFTTGGTAGTYYAYGTVLAQDVAATSGVAITESEGHV